MKRVVNAMAAGEGLDYVQCGSVGRGLGTRGCECLYEKFLAAVARRHFGGRAKVKCDEVLEGVDAGITEGIEVWGEGFFEFGLYYGEPAGPQLRRGEGFLGR